MLLLFKLCGICVNSLRRRPTRIEPAQAKNTVEQTPTIATATISARQVAELSVSDNVDDLVSSWAVLSRSNTASITEDALASLITKDPISSDGRGPISSGTAEVQKDLEDAYAYYLPAFILGLDETYAVVIILKGLSFSGDTITLMSEVIFFINVDKIIK